MTAPVARLPLLLAAAVGLCLPALPTAAGGYGCATAECYRYVTIPPVYGTVPEQVMVRPGRTITRVVPPVYDTVTEQVLAAPPSRVWQTSYDDNGQLVGCWVTTPARYATRTRQVMVRPPEVVPEVIPPAYAIYHRKVLVEPARSGWVPAGSHGGYAPGYPGTYASPVGAGPAFGGPYGGY
ncbi:hypothetical protein [Methylobacterium nodulans]|uniref:Uncharacterized protein n=1 Tax=Methylobacterium nodulans (strain LMG 21967 / CNCM I-2342 / ORS 2060) TaxID=460265 RepID=B8IGS3_METNO|nr:hypothetical protein [Methylobacterium nodulans]ACL57798.1 conserved hypothetical protein [Methylobacterium nodulans ORS 2060]